ncbi:MAG: ABC transporter ATP-binding protein [Verrucomicrobia bacterium]|nr:MAG: ABC transporter ATP-binding protein [Verrucomicrobiota bacterium]
MTNCWRGARYTPVFTTPRLNQNGPPSSFPDDAVTAIDSTRGPSTLQLCAWLTGYAWRRRLELAVVLVTMLLRVGLDVLKPWPMVFLVDYVLQGKATLTMFPRLVEGLPGAHTTPHLIGWSVVATVGIFLFSWAVGLANAYANISLGQRMVYDLAADLFGKLQQLSLHFHARKSVGDNIRRVTTDGTCVSIVVKDALVPLVSALISLVVMFSILWRIDATLTLLALAVVPYLALVFHFYAARMMDRSYRQQEIEGRIYSLIEETFSAIPVVQAFGREEFNDGRFKQATRDTLGATLSLTKVQLQFKILIGLATAAGTAVILFVGTRHALNGPLAIGAILVFLSYLGSLYAPLEAVMYSTSTLQGAAGSARRVREILQTEREVADRPDARALSSVSGQVQIEDVTFGYEADRPILRHLSLEVRPGETVAIVGATGAGKSTLVSLVPRFFDPWEGRVLVDGCDVRGVQLKSLRRHIAIVLQEPFLFPVSITDNIAYGVPRVATPEIEAAARAAGAHEFILRLPNGYQTVIGERGATLSGGERQRISIARALLKNAPILILDEPTSALDVETEGALLRALDRLTKGRSTLIIAHRLSTVRRADRIVVLRDGQIVETGTHDELLKRGQVYAGFYQLQFGNEVNHEGHAR